MALVIAENAHAMKAFQAQLAIVQQQLRIVLVPLALKNRMQNCAQVMENASAISVNVKAHILANFVRALQAMKL